MRGSIAWFRYAAVLVVVTGVSFLSFSALAGDETPSPTKGSPVSCADGENLLFTTFYAGVGASTETSAEAADVFLSRKEMTLSAQDLRRIPASSFADSPNGVSGEKMEVLTDPSNQIAIFIGTTPEGRYITEAVVACESFAKEQYGAAA